MESTQALRDYLVQLCFQGHAPADFDDDYDLVEQGVMDSLATMTLITHLENQYRIEFGEHDFVPEHFCSVNAVCRFLARKLTPDIA